MVDDLISRQAAIDARDGRIFQEIVVEYPSYNPYPEYKGKPYFSIKYIENGQEFIGYGTYSQAVLSEYLKKYFMPSAEPELDKMGYRLVKKQGSNALLPCTCGYGKPKEWFQFTGVKGYIYRCEKCNKEGKLCKTKIGARRLWNQMILMEKQSND